MTALRILFAAAFVYGVCRAAGQLLFRAIGLQLRQYERAFLEFVTGAALTGTFVFFLALCHVIYTSVVVALGLIVMLAALRIARHRTKPEQDPPLPTRWWILFLVPYIIFGVVYLLAAMSPEISPDGTGYHLGLVSRYYDHRGFYPVKNYMFAGLAEGVEMLFLLAFALGRHSAAAMVHLLFLLTLPFGMIAWARRIGAPGAGVVGALLFYLAPVVGKDGTIAYIDVATAAVVFAAFCFLEMWRRDGAQPALIPAGILAGFAFACKITAATAIPYALLYVVIVCAARKTPWLPAVRMAGIIALGATVFAAPWMVKDAIQFHNPFFPIFNLWFPNPFMYPIAELEIRRAMAHMSDVPYIRMPYEAIIGGQLTGVLGPVFVLSPLALLAIRSQPGRMLLLAFAAAALPFFGNTGTRFLIPALPFLALAIGLALPASPRASLAIGSAVILLHSVLSWPDVIDHWSPGFQWRLETMDWRVPLRITPEKQYLEQHWRDYQPGLMVDRLVPAADLVFSPDMGQRAYQHRELLGSFESALSRRVYLMFVTPLVPDLGSNLHREFRFSAVTTRKISLVANTKADIDLRIGEIRFALGTAEIRREPTWQLTASVNPWEIQYAFDNSPVSWWTSGQAAEPGQSVQVDFGRAVTIDRILLDQNADQRPISLRPAAYVAGAWRYLQATETADEKPPAASLRMQVRDEMKALGVHWILIADGSYGADDLREKTGYWGTTQVAEANGFRLWKLN